MLYIYRILINIVVLISPIIILFRLLKKKEDPKRFLEKYGISSKGKINGKIVWLHGSSVGEILSIIPLIERLEKNKNIKNILLTSSTVSSSKVIQNFKLKKTIHQFYPIDSNIIINRFLDNWKPNSAIFIESEIWPNMILNLKKRNIPLILLNARITKKTYKKWKGIYLFSKNLFEKFDICLVQNDETNFYLKKLGAKKIKHIGNLKFSETNLKIKQKIQLSKKNFLYSKKILFTAVSTHHGEEVFCGKLHTTLIKKHKNAISIIIPRHTQRCPEIIDSLEEIGLKVYLHSSKKPINESVDVYIVDTYGETETFLKMSKIVFLGGSLIKRGGQNPLEPARIGCKVIHGPHVENFQEVYQLLNKIGISSKIKSINQGISIINKYLKNGSNSKKNISKLNKIGNQILIKNYSCIRKYI